MKIANYPENVLCAVAHQLKNPINAIIGLSEILKKMILETNFNQKEYIEYTNDIITVAADMNELIHDLLDVNMAYQCNSFAKAQSAIDLKDIILRSARINREFLIQKKLSLKVEIESDIGFFLIDKKRLKQIINNLVSNSIRNSPKNTEIMILAKKIKRKNSKHLRISVSDQGYEMSEKQIDLILNNSSNYLNNCNHSSIYSSSDLTLSIVKELVQRQGGKIYTSSQVNYGTTISIEFPTKDIES